MTAPAYFIAMEPGRGTAARVDGGEVEVRPFTWEAGAEEPPLARRADATRKVLGVLGHAGEGICLGLPSAWVLSAPIACDGLPRKGRRQAMVYRLEDHLPFDAEHLTADFLPAVGGRRLGVAIETDRTRDLLDHLTEAGVEVEAVCPTALLALWTLTAEYDPGADYVLVDNEEDVDLFRFAEGQPVRWYAAARDPAEVVRTVEANLLAGPADPSRTLTLAAAATEPEFLSAVSDPTGLVCERVAEESAVHLAAVAARDLLAGRGAGWVNLRRDGLGLPNRLGRLRRPVRTALVLGALLLAVVCGGAWYRAGRYRGEADRLAGRQGAIFARLYPNQRTPTSVRTWLASEAARLSGVSGSTRGVPQTPSALTTLKKVADGLPAEVRFRLTDIRIEPGGVYLEGQARTHAGAEAVARGIAGDGAFAMEPPRTESLAAGGVSFTLAGTPAEPSTEARGMSAANSREPQAAAPQPAAAASKGPTP